VSNGCGNGVGSVGGVVGMVGALVEAVCVAEAGAEVEGEGNTIIEEGVVATAAAVETPPSCGPVACRRTCRGCSPHIPRCHQVEFGSPGNVESRSNAAGWATYFVERVMRMRIAGTRRTAK